MIFSREFQRGKLRVLTEGLGGDLVRGNAGADVAFFFGGTHAAQPGGRAQRVDTGIIRSMMRQVADDHDALAHRLERAQDRAEREVRTVTRGSEVFHDRPVRHIHETQTAHGAGCGLALGSQRRDHRIQQRQCDRRPRSSQQSAARQVFLGDDAHDFTSSLSCNLLPGVRRFRYLGPPHLERSAADNA